MSDRLGALLEHYSITARVFHTGTLCGINDLPGDGGDGQLHLIRAGVVDVIHSGTKAVTITEPSLLLYPLPMALMMSRCVNTACSSSLIAQPLCAKCAAC